jgi:hypothetical protein
MFATILRIHRLQNPSKITSCPPKGIANENFNYSQWAVLTLTRTKEPQATFIACPFSRFVKAVVRPDKRLWVAQNHSPYPSLQRIPQSLD